VNLANGLSASVVSDGMMRCAAFVHCHHVSVLFLNICLSWSKTRFPDAPWTSDRYALKSMQCDGIIVSGSCHELKSSF
jgi:hypothetical protein